MICDQLILLRFGHRSEGVEGASELTLELAASLNNFLFNLISLLSRDSRSKRIICQVTSDSDASRLDHGRVLRREWRALKFSVVHITDVAGSLSMTMILLNNLVHQGRKGSVRVMRASIDTDTGIYILTS